MKNYRIKEFGPPERRVFVIEEEVISPFQFDGCSRIYQQVFPKVTYTSLEEAKKALDLRRKRDEEIEAYEKKCEPVYHYHSQLP